VSHDDRRRRRDEARALLGRPRWGADEVDYAIALHDLLETPEDGPDPVAVELRMRLTPALNRRFDSTGHQVAQLRAAFFTAGWLDVADALERRLCVLFYLGLTSFLGFQTGALGQLDRSIQALSELDREVRRIGNRAREILGPRYGSALFSLATACVTRYESRRELLLLDQTTEAERADITADLDRAVDACRQVITQQQEPSSRPGAIGLLGFCYALRYEDDERYAHPRTIDSAIGLLRDAAAMAGNDPGPGGVMLRIGISDRLAGALLVRNRSQDVEEAIGILTQVRSEAASEPMYTDAGGAVTLATALLRRWTHTRSVQDEKNARSAYAGAFATAIVSHPLAAEQIASQRGGWAWREGWWSEAGEAYSLALRALHLAVRRQASRSHRDLIVRKVPGVAAMAAFGLARAGAGEAALVALETGRAILLSEWFDRQALDLSRIARLAGPQEARRYQQLTDKMTQMEGELLASPDGNARTAVDLDAVRQERYAFAVSLGKNVQASLSDLDQPPDLAALRGAAGSTPVAYLAATTAGGIALVLRAEAEPAVQAVELPRLTRESAAKLAAALQQAVAARDTGACEQVCETLWTWVMRYLLPVLGGARHAIMVPGGMLSALPWHAAQEPGQPRRHVLDRVALSYMPNLRALPEARAGLGQLRRPMTTLAIGQPTPSAMVPLSTDEEIATVRSYDGDALRVARLSGAEATSDVLRGGLARFQVLHFAGHAMAMPGDPLESALMLAHDQRLTVRDLLTAGAVAGRFAVLSACDTAGSQDPLSDEMVNFPTALLQCGFSGVVGTTWRSYDKPAAAIMDAFYREWLVHHMPPAQALRAAQAWTRDHGFTSPLAWANFVYVGP
jgi:CHAT domain